jgi:hypothetical protein
MLDDAVSTPLDKNSNSNNTTLLYYNKHYYDLAFWFYAQFGRLKRKRVSL